MNQTQEIEQLRKKVALYEEIINETSAPIIPSIIDNTILLPIVGFTDKNRFERIRASVLDYTGVNRHIESAVFDFSSTRISKEEGSDVMTRELRLMQAELKLMGVRPLMVGFTPIFVRELTDAGIADEIEAYGNFKSALQVLMRDKGLTLTNKSF